MAVKKVTKEEVEVNVAEQATNDVEVSTVDTNEVDTTVDTEVEEDKEDEVIPEVEIPEVKVEEPQVDVDIESAEVKDCNRPNSGVKIRMRVDHSCTIAMERYDLKAGKTYIVPANVKRILNNAGLLSPL